MLLLIVFFVFGILLNIFGGKVVWITAGIGFALAIITFGASAYISALLIMPVALRVLYNMIKPYMGTLKQ